MNIGKVEASGYDQSSKQRKPKSREVSSRFLSPLSTVTTPTIESIVQSPNLTLSPIRQKTKSSTDHGRKHHSLEASGFLRGLWPSSSATSNNPDNSLPDTPEKPKLKDLLDPKDNRKPENSNSMLLNRQRSCTEFSRFENRKESVKKYNHKPFFRFPRRSSTSSSSSSSKSSTFVDDHDHINIVPPRLSVDETALRRKAFARRSDSTLSDQTQDTESECSDICSGNSFESPVVGKNFRASYMAPTVVSSRKAGIEVSSKYLNEVPSTSRRWTIDSKAEQAVSSDNIPSKRLTIKDRVKRTNSLASNFRSSNSKWALSPGRSSSPPLSADNKAMPLSYLSTKPPTSPSGPKPKGTVGDLLSMGLELFKSKKSSSNSSTSAASPLGPTSITESSHQLRMLQNRLMQWRYAGARVQAVNRSITRQAETNLVHAWTGLAKLQHSVQHKKLRLEKQKLQMKLNVVLHSQVKQLEAWGEMERQHVSAVSMTTDSLQSVICRVPLIEGAHVEPLSVSVAIRHATDLAAAIKSVLATSSPVAEKTVPMLSELAEVFAQEKSSLEECLELFRIISTLETKQRSLKCSLIQLKQQ